MHAQTAASAKPDIYANFVGVWVGTDKYLKDGKEITRAVRVTIQETKNGMKWDYVYGTGDQKDDRYTRLVTFHPSKSEIIFRYDDAEAEHFKAVDLDALEKNGYGVFYATNAYGEEGKKTTYLVKFDLEADTFRYGWFHSEDGKNFAQTSSYSLKRETGASTESH